MDIDTAASLNLQLHLLVIMYATAFRKEPEKFEPFAERLLRTCRFGSFVPPIARPGVGGDDFATVERTIELAQFFVDQVRAELDR